MTLRTGEVKPHGEASPRLVAGPGGRLAIVWPREVPVAGRPWPASAIRVARSLDGGRTWLAPVTVNDDTTGVPAGHNFQGAAWAGDSGLVAAWLDERSGVPLAHDHATAATGNDPTSEPDATVFLASPPDFGRTWIRNRAVWGGACPCCRITLARGGDGGVVAAWRGHFPGNVRDVVTAAIAPRSEPPTRVHEDGWIYPGCPHNGPGLSLGADGIRHVVWYTAANGTAGLDDRAVSMTGAHGGAPARAPASRCPWSRAGTPAGARRGRGTPGRRRSCRNGRPFGRHPTHQRRRAPARCAARPYRGGARQRGRPLSADSERFRHRRAGGVHSRARGASGASLVGRPTGDAPSGSASRFYATAPSVGLPTVFAAAHPRR